MKDLQNESDDRNIPINKVGVGDVRYPIFLKDRQYGEQHTIGTVNMYVNLPENFRGTHMSRFIEILHAHANRMELQNVQEILLDMKRLLRANQAHMTMMFPYTIEKHAPVTGIKSHMVIDCAFDATLDKNDQFIFVLVVTVPIQTVCPCSKAISDRGAHNQRAYVTVKMKMSKMVWIEEVVEEIEKAASSPVFPLLKRSDEKYITERGYDNPKFVEDVARDLAIELKKNFSVKWFRLSVTSQESIHNHHAYACLEWERKQA
ncbi:MAG: GTP cyclohydrolase FolE2 [Thermotogota bacterium]|nr:GTP cyclohydrolase FolE2 [Thermotogota bacterium]